MTKMFTKGGRARGFTLIELLVVIAIIGILSSVVLVSLNSARTKGVSTRVQEDAANIRTQLETDYTGSAYPDLTMASNLAACSTYADCGVDTQITGAFASGNNIDTLALDIASEVSGTKNTAGSATSASGLKVYDGGSSLTSIAAYAVYVFFPGKSGGYCVDSTGNTRSFTTNTGAFTTGSNFITCSTATAL